MNNKRGGVGGKLLLVLILMIASAVGGAYGYSVMDGKMAVSDAKKVIERVNVSDYDSTDSDFWKCNYKTLCKRCRSYCNGCNCA